MADHLVVYTTNATYGSRLERFTRLSRRGRLSGWTGTGKMVPGDGVFFYFTKPTQSVMATGRVRSAPKLERAGNVDWTSPNRMIAVVDYEDIRSLDQPIRMPATHNRKLAQWCSGQPFRNSRTLDADIAAELWAEIRAFNPNGVPGRGRKRKNDGRLFDEGARSQIVRELVLRDPRLKAEAIARYGYDCMICGVNFEQFYGPVGRGYIEMHHLKLLAAGGATLTGVEDVIVVCPNCHRVLHKRSGRPMPWRELKRVVERQRR